MLASALERLLELTRAQKTVLCYLQAKTDPNTHVAVASSREIAATTGLSRRTVQPAIDRLNELQFIKTCTRGHTAPSIHTLLAVVMVSPPSGPGVPVAGGAIEADEAAPVQNAYKCATPSGANPQPVRGAIVEKTPTYPQTHIRKTRVNTPPHSPERVVSVSTVVEDVCKTRPSGAKDRYGRSESASPISPMGQKQQTLFIESAEILALVEGFFDSPVPTYLRVGFTRLSEQFRIPELSVIRFLEEKWRDKLHTRNRIFSPAALLRFAHEDLPRWIPFNYGRIQRDRWFLAPASKPATLEVMPPPLPLLHPLAAGVYA